MSKKHKCKNKYGASPTKQGVELINAATIVPLDELKHENSFFAGA
jgi:hypothetical protein